MDLLTISTDDDHDHLVSRLDKLFPVSSQSIASAIEEMRTTSAMAVAAGMVHTPKIKPLMVGKHANFFKDGVCFEVTKKARQADVLAAGGRYAFSSRSLNQLLRS